MQDPQPDQEIPRENKTIGKDVQRTAHGVWWHEASLMAGDRLDWGPSSCVLDEPTSGVDLLR